MLDTIKKKIDTNPGIISCLAGAFILFCSFGVRQTLGVFLIPVTSETGWDRSTFSIAAGLLQLFWGVSQPFLVYLGERKFGFGKTIFCCCLVYAVGCFILYASDISSGLFIFAMGIVIGTGCGGNSFPIVLAAVGRRYPQGSQKQRVAFGMVSSLGSLGQCCFLPIARAMIEAIGWRYSFITFGAIVVVSAPFAYFLRTVPPIPSEQPPKIEDEPTTILDMNSESTKEEKNTTEENHTKENNDVEKGILAVLKEAFSSPIFIMICIGFSVCGFHVSFLATHLPAYLQDHGIDSSLAAWTISIMGLGSMLGSMGVGYLANYISPRTALMGIYLLRAILMIIFVFIPISITTVIVFSCLFGFLWLTTVPFTTMFIGDVFGHTYLGTLSSITFVGHQFGAFIGAYVGGVVYDQLHSYDRMWYGSLAASILAVIANFFARPNFVNKTIKQDPHQLK